MLFFNFLLIDGHSPHLNFVKELLLFSAMAALNYVFKNTPIWFSFLEFGLDILLK